MLWYIIIRNFEIYGGFFIMDLPGEPSSLIIFSVIAIVAVVYFMYMNGVGYFRSMSALWFYQTHGILEDNIHASLKKN